MKRKKVPCTYISFARVKPSIWVMSIRLIWSAKICDLSVFPPLQCHESYKSLLNVLHLQYVSVSFTFAFFCLYCFRDCYFCSCSVCINNTNSFHFIQFSFACCRTEWFKALNKWMMSLLDRLRRLSSSLRFLSSIRFFCYPSFLFERRERV